MPAEYSTDSFKAQWLSDAEMPLANKFYRNHNFRGKARRHEPCAVIRGPQTGIIACGCLRNLTDSQLLVGVAVAPDFQGKGVARRLLTFMREAFDEKTFTFPYSNLVSFYESLGFTGVSIDGLPSAITDRFLTYQKQGRDISIQRYKGRQ